MARRPSEFIKVNFVSRTIPKIERNNETYDEGLPGNTAVLLTYAVSPCLCTPLLAKLGNSGAKISRIFQYDADPQNPKYKSGYRAKFKSNRRVAENGKCQPVTMNGGAVFKLKSYSMNFISIFRKHGSHNENNSSLSSSKMFNCEINCEK